ncbi:MAG: phosphate acyltransferase PlsX [Clostridia bacterium]|nr:phosphate acyltransferase PlsX [Clostridia bacterium]
MIRLVIDCFGGDKSPSVNVEGSIRALEQFPDLSLILTGDETAVRAELDRLGASEGERLSVVHAPDVIGCDEKPTDAIRIKKDSSMMRAVQLLRSDDDISGMVSIGSTGALVAASVLRVGRLRGVCRPAFCPILPTMNGGIVGICDSGANVECKPDYLRQFAVMGSRYLEQVYGVENPRVALLNVGVEAEKGDELHKEAYRLLSDTPGLNFVGNMESRDLLTGRYDLVVCDGFSGNVLVKSTEGTALELLKKLKRDIYSRTKYKIGAFIMRKMFAEEKEFMNYQNYGGSVMLGCARNIVKGHGSSDAVSFAKCIEQAYRMEQSGLSGLIEADLDRLPNAKI